MANESKRKNEQIDKSLFLAQWFGWQTLATFITVTILVFYTVIEIFYFPNWINLFDHILIPTVLLSMFIAQHVTLRRIMPRTLFKASLLFIFASLVSAFPNISSDNYEILLYNGEPLERILLSLAVILPFLIAQGYLFWRDLTAPSLRRITMYLICNLVGYLLFWHLLVDLYTDLIWYLGISLLLAQGFLILWVVNDND